MPEFIYTPQEIAEGVNGKQNGPARGNPEYLRSPEQEPTAVLRFSQTGLMRALNQPTTQESASILGQIIATNNSPELKAAVQKLQNTRVPKLKIF